MPNSKPLPLLPAYQELKAISLNDYPDVKRFLESGPEWRFQHWQWALDFLLYVGRNKSEHTYSRFRNETERFLLWVFLIKEKPMEDFRKADVLEYADFCWKPPVSWISFASADRFLLQGGCYQVNSEWLPFRLKKIKNQINQIRDKKKYRPSQETLKAMFTAIIVFYKHLMNEEKCFGNPAQLAKNDCRYLIKDAQVKEIHRLTDVQWQYVLNTADKMAIDNTDYERSLFVVATLKTLFLRISELSERDAWRPVMSHFWQDHDENWWL
ncbi:MAG: hypothetical protein JKY01_01325, partial [Pseudomonadales bacterium]|nr:hypothetical protein [Pseudomonadales bacterium]